MKRRTKAEEAILRKLRRQAAQRLADEAQANWRMRCAAADASGGTVGCAPEPPRPTVEDIMIAVRTTRYMLPEDLSGLVLSQLLSWD